MTAKRFITLLLIALLASVTLLSVAAAQDGGSASSRPYLGIYFSVTDGGVRVDEVIPQGPAAEAGLLAADIITAVDGTPITEGDFAQLLAGYRSGDTVTLTVLRGDETLDIDVTLGAHLNRMERRETPGRPGIVPPRIAPLFPDLLTDRPYLGVRLADSAPEAEAEGEDAAVIVTIEDVVAESPAEAAGLLAGDVLTAVNGEAVTSAEQAVTLVQALEPGAELTLTVERDGEPVEITATLGSAADAPEQFFGLPRIIPGDGRLPFEFEIVPGDGRRFQIPQIPGLPLAPAARLGVGFVMLDAQGAELYDTALTEGAYLTQVLPQTPAELAGLVAGDIVTAVDDEPLTLDYTLRDAITGRQPGDVLTLTVVRGDETLEITVTLGQPEQFSLEALPQS